MRRDGFRFGNVLPFSNRQGIRAGGYTEYLIATKWALDCG